MRRTFTLPDGRRVTTKTKRDYALVVNTYTDAWVEVRSDFSERLKAIVRRQVKAFSRAERPVEFYIGNTITGELARYPEEK